ncbi:MAG: RidA family protein [Chloroflexi bacterium]|nr:RidA family protein [Chloroflexota bacterium]
MGPIDPSTGQIVLGGVKDQTRQVLANLKAKLEAAGSSFDKVVWSTWALRDPTEYDNFAEEWSHAFGGKVPFGQGSLMPTPERRLGFRISIGVIASA